VLVLVASRAPVLVPASVIVGLTIGLDILAALRPEDPNARVLIAFRAHLGGFVTGCRLILVMKYRDVPLFQSAAIYPENGFGALGRLMMTSAPAPMSAPPLPRSGGGCCSGSRRWASSWQS
jgi:NAD-dependent oxidoreductase involved in siderophore biosynthesis